MDLSHLTVMIELEHDIVSALCLKLISDQSVQDYMANMIDPLRCIMIYDAHA